MTATPPSLEQIQRWLQSVIMHPGSAVEGISSPAARQHLEIAPSELESVVRRSQSLSAAARLEIYVNAYYERLLECLREEFPATRHVLGDELFDALAFGYLQQYPSRSYTLARLATNFPNYLEQSPLHAQARPDNAPPHWEQFVIELAAYEVVLRDVFDSQGNEDQPGADLAKQVPPAGASWEQARFVPTPSLRLARFDHPVHEYWAALKEDLQPPIPEPRAVCLVVHRRRYIVERHEFSLLQYALVEALFEGQTLEQALSQLATKGNLDVSELSSHLVEWFAHWAQLGLFGSVQFVF